MKTKKLLTGVAAVAVCAAMVTPTAINAASGLSWKDGAPANYHFTYAGDTGHIEGVYVSDTNRTFDGKIVKGQTVTTQTGTIAWRDSYTNKTTITVDVENGYELVGLEGNVGEAYFTEVNHKDSIYTFSFTDKGAESWCFGDDVSFKLVTKPRTYHVYAEKDRAKPYLLTSGSIGTPLPNGNAPIGKYFVGWKNYKLEENEYANKISSELIQSADSQDIILVKGEYAPTVCNVKLEFYSDNTFGKYDGVKQNKTESIKVPYGTVINEEYIHDTLKIDEKYDIVGGSVVVKSNQTIKLVDPTEEPERVGNRTYSMKYAGSDKGIESVSFKVNGGEEQVLLLNETIHVYDKIDFSPTNVEFTVVVKEGYSPELDCAGYILTNVEENTYTFTISVEGCNNVAWAKPSHTNFSLSTIEK